jgi:hypothetical protein
LKVSKILFVHASRERVERAYVAYERLTKRMTTGTPYRYILSLDTDDKYLEGYKERFANLPEVEIIINDNSGCVPATNKGVDLLKEEDLIFINGDDLGSPEGWDAVLLDFIETIEDDIFLVHLAHNIPNSSNCAIIQCVSAGFYRKRGFFFYPAFISMYADNEIFLAAKAMNKVFAGPAIEFVHEHPCFGFDVPFDDTYKRTSSPENFKIGERILNERINDNFGL